MSDKVTLYIGKHNITGLKYFGKTTVYHTQLDLQKYYHGSGNYWKNHLKVHGDDVTMEIYGIYKISEVKEIALKFSEDNDIVKAVNEDGKKVWANEKPENGLDGGSIKGTKMSPEQKIKISKANKGIKPSLGNNKAVSIANKGKCVYKDINGNNVRCNIDDPRVISGELVHRNKNQKAANSLYIKIYDMLGKLIYECDGDFKKVCKNNNLPTKALAKSYRSEGEPIYNTKYKLSKVSDENKQFEGWYALKIK